MDGRIRRHAWPGIVTVLAAAVLGPVLAGCTKPDDSGVAGEAADRPAEKLATVEMEGMAQEIRVVLYRSPAGFPLPFSTYVPDDMIGEPAATGATPGVRFVANFGGHRNDAAAMRMMAQREGATEEDAVAMLRELARDLGTELVEEQEPRFSWSVREFRNVASAVRHSAAEGIMAIGERDGHIFAVAIHHPAEYGDGFGPRAGVILDEWRWEETGDRLGR